MASGGVTPDPLQNDKSSSEDNDLPDTDVEASLDTTDASDKGMAQSFEEESSPDNNMASATDPKENLQSSLISSSGSEVPPPTEKTCVADEMPSASSNPLSNESCGADSQPDDKTPTPTIEKKTTPKFDPYLNEIILSQMGLRNPFLDNLLRARNAQSHDLPVADSRVLQPQNIMSPPYATHLTWDGASPDFVFNGMPASHANVPFTVGGNSSSFNTMPAEYYALSSYNRMPRGGVPLFSDVLYTALPYSSVAPSNISAFSAHSSMAPVYSVPPLNNSMPPMYGMAPTYISVAPSHHSVPPSNNFMPFTYSVPSNTYISVSSASTDIIPGYSMAASNNSIPSMYSVLPTSLGVATSNSNMAPMYSMAPSYNSMTSACSVTRSGTNMAPMHNSIASSTSQLQTVSSPPVSMATQLGGVTPPFKGVPSPFPRDVRRNQGMVPRGKPQHLKAPVPYGISNGVAVPIRCLVRPLNIVAHPSAGVAPFSPNIPPPPLHVVVRPFTGGMVSGSKITPQFNGMPRPASSVFPFASIPPPPVRRLSTGLPPSFTSIPPPLHAMGLPANIQAPSITTIPPPLHAMAHPANARAVSFISSPPPTGALVPTFAGMRPSFPVMPSPRFIISPSAGPSIPSFNAVPPRSLHFDPEFLRVPPPRLSSSNNASQFDGKNPLSKKSSAVKSRARKSKTKASVNNVVPNPASDTSSNHSQSGNGDNKD